jgi:leucyl/phenylalanyl-tRNA--protein transferase
LTPERILEAYAGGIFPMAEPEGTLGWWSPDPRGVIELTSDHHVARRLRRRMRAFEIRFDTDFDGVVQGCARPEGTWISAQIWREYRRLFDQGRCHTVEAWQGELLAGGLYGVSIGAAFMAESMFHAVTDASKVALVALVERLLATGFTLLDVQYVTPHLARMGARWISRADYLARLHEAIALENRSFGSP